MHRPRAHIYAWATRGMPGHSTIIRCSCTCRIRSHALLDWAMPAMLPHARHCFVLALALPRSFLSFHSGPSDRPGLGVHIPQRSNFAPLPVEAGEAVVGLDMGVGRVPRGQRTPLSIFVVHISTVEVAAPAAAQAALHRHWRLDRYPLHDAGKDQRRPCRN